MVEVVNYQIDENDSDFERKPVARKQPIPDSLKQVFASKPRNADPAKPSLFTKTMNAKSLNVAADSATV